MDEDSMDQIDVDMLVELNNTLESEPQPEERLAGHKSDAGVSDIAPVTPTDFMDVDADGGSVVVENDTRDDSVASVAPQPAETGAVSGSSYHQTVRQRMKGVYIDQNHLTPVQRAQYENRSPLLDRVADEQVMSFVSGSTTEGWIKKYGLVDHIFIRRTLTPEERKIAAASPPFDPLKHQKFIPSNCLQSSHSTSHASSVSPADDMPRFRKAIKKPVRYGVTETLSDSPKFSSSPPARKRPRRSIKVPARYSIVSDDDDISSQPQKRGRGRRREVQTPPVGESSFEEDLTEEDISESDQTDSDRFRKAPTRKSSRVAKKSTWAAIGNDDITTDEDMKKASQGPSSRSNSVVQYSTRGRGRPMKNVAHLKLEEQEEGNDELAWSEEEKGDDSEILIEERVLSKHRKRCDKCADVPAEEMLNGISKRPKSTQRKSKSSDELMEDDSTYANRLGGWLSCVICCSAYHWDCIAASARSAMVKADKQKPERYRFLLNDMLPPDESMPFTCSRCADPVKGPCFICRSAEPLTKVIETDEAESVLIKRSSAPEVVEQIPLHKAAPSKSGAYLNEKDNQSTTTGEASTLESTVIVIESQEKQVKKRDDDLLFRCTRCKLGFHYAHLKRIGPLSETSSISQVANQYQQADTEGRWTCYLCKQWRRSPEKIIAWKPSPLDAQEPAVEEGDYPPGWKGWLPREYLVKWKDCGFRHLDWVPHDWLLSLALNNLARFLKNGASLELETETTMAMRKDDEMENAANQAFSVPGEELAGLDKIWVADHLRPDPEAQSHIPTSWITVDRVLDVQFARQSKSQAKRKEKHAVLSDTEDGAVEIDRQHGELLNEDDMISIDDWESKNRKLTPEDADELAPLVAWCYAKWVDLQYEQATIDTPPPMDSPLWPAFVAAFRHYLRARTVVIPVLSQEAEKTRDHRVTNAFQRLPTQPECIVGGTLMDFQMEGFNWLMSKWHNRQSVILADDMGLGKTIQVSSLLGYLGSEKFKIYPHLLVVPNSTLTNWVRELEKWVPHLNVVPYFGSGPSRQVIRNYELFHQKEGSRKPSLKAHVVLTSYEVVTSKDFKYFKQVPRWETLIVDEGQRLKSGTAQIFRNLNELKVPFKVLMTGTPLNNTIREILNLLNFLDPEEWNDLDEEEKKYENPDEALYAQLRQRIAPYMLRRKKEDVLNLQPKHEIIVPLSMRPFQKQVYKSILTKNADLMAALAKANQAGKSTDKRAAVKLENLKFLIMHLRKCVQHPYLNQASLQNLDRPAAEVQQSLIDVSGKLCFLKLLLPKLKAKGHRALIFSQFKIHLDIMEEFCQGENMRFLRLDGGTPQSQRQQDIDRYNAPNSDYFLYMLSTRAGGVGINLATADTVIILDPDWNPHQDMQAIARAYRIGQQKKVHVFRLMMQGTVEENIMQAAKKKLMLDHLIVQRQDENDNESFEQVVLRGAQAILESKDGEADARWDSAAVDDLIEEMENRVDAPAAKSAGFTFAPVYDSKTKVVADLEESTLPAAGVADAAYWDALERKIRDENVQTQVEQYGRGARARASKAKYTFDADPAQASSPLRDLPDSDSDPNFALGPNDRFSDVESELGDDQALNLLEELGEPSGTAGKVRGTLANGTSAADILVKGVGQPSQKDSQRDHRPPHRRSNGKENGGSAIGHVALPGPSLRTSSSEPAAPVIRRRLSLTAIAEGIRIKPLELALYHFRRLHLYMKRAGLDETAFLDNILDPTRPGDARFTDYYQRATAIDDLLHQNGEERLFTRTKTLREVEYLLRCDAATLVHRWNLAQTEAKAPAHVRSQKQTVQIAPSIQRQQSYLPPIPLQPIQHLQQGQQPRLLQQQILAPRPSAPVTSHTAPFQGSQPQSITPTIPALRPNLPPANLSAANLPAAILSPANPIPSPYPSPPHIQALPGTISALPSGLAVATATSIDDQESCSLCFKHGHLVDVCPELKTVDGIKQAIQTVLNGPDEEDSKDLVISWLEEKLDDLAYPDGTADDDVIYLGTSIATAAPAPALDANLLQPQRTDVGQARDHTLQQQIPVITAARNACEENFMDSPLGIVPYIEGLYNCPVCWNQTTHSLEQCEIMRAGRRMRFCAWNKYKEVDPALAQRVQVVDSVLEAQHPTLSRHLNPCPYCHNTHEEALHECIWFHGGQSAGQAKETELLQMRNDPGLAGRAA